MGEDKSTHHIAENRNREACHSPVKEYVTLTCRVPTARASFVKSILLFCCYQRHLPKLIWSCINSQNTLGCFFLIRKFKFSSVILSPFPSLKNLFSLVSVIQKKKKKLFVIPWSGGGEAQHNFFLLPRSFYPFFKVLSILQGWVDLLDLSTNISLLFLHEMHVPISLDPLHGCGTHTVTRDPKLRRASAWLNTLLLWKFQAIKKKKKSK